MVTTESEERKKQEGRAAGATGWIVKPFRADQLVAVAKRFLK
jgi:two-component system chemotaxis response regulator CheY